MAISLKYTIWAENGGPSGAIDTTGVSLIVLTTTGPIAPGVSDNLGNTWIARPAYGGAVKIQYFYCINPIVGQAHTFGTNPACAIIVHTFYGANPYLVDVGAAYSGSPASGQYTGVVNPTTNGALILTGMVSNNSTELWTQYPQPPTDSFTSAWTQGVAGTVGFYVQGAAAPVNVLWTWTQFPSDVAMATIVFAEGPPVPPTPGRVSQYVVELVGSGSGPGSGGAAPARVSQYYVELLTPAVPPPRIFGLGIEGIGAYVVTPAVQPVAFHVSFTLHTDPPGSGGDGHYLIDPVFPGQDETNLIVDRFEYFSRRPRVSLRWHLCERCGLQYPEDRVVVQKGRIRCTGENTNHCADDEYGAGYYRRRVEVPYEVIPEPPPIRDWEDD